MNRPGQVPRSIVRLGKKRDFPGHQTAFFFSTLASGVPKSLQGSKPQRQFRLHSQRHSHLSLPEMRRQKAACKNLLPSWEVLLKFIIACLVWSSIHSTLKASLSNYRNWCEYSEYHLKNSLSSSLRGPSMFMGRRDSPSPFALATLLSNRA